MSVYQMDLRRKVIAALEQGHPVASVARRFDIDEKTVRSYRRRARLGQLEPGRSGPKHPTKLTDADLQLLRDALAAKPDLTLLELSRMLSTPVAQSTVHRTLRRMKITFKKSR